MRGAPVPPVELWDAEDGEPLLDTDEKLEAAGWAAGLHVWEQMGKAYEHYLYYGGGDKPSGLDNAQMWSLRRAIRRELLEELGMDVSRA